jgi:hypothetical protein
MQSPSDFEKSISDIVFLADKRQESRNGHSHDLAFFHSPYGDKIGSKPICI